MKIKKLLCWFFGCKRPPSMRHSLNALMKGFICVRCGKIYKEVEWPRMPQCNPDKPEN
jgi:hypothetical protein